MHLSLLSVVSVAEGMQSTVANVLFPAIRQSLGLRLDVFGLLQAVPQLATALCGPAWSAIAQRTNRKTVLVICAVCGGIWAIAAGFAHDLEQLMCMYVLGAIFFSGGGPIMNSLLTDLFEAKVRGRAIGYLYGIVALSTSITAPAIGLLSRVPEGWRYGFFTAGAVCVVSGFLVAVFVRDPGVGAAEPELRGFNRAEREQYSRLTWAKARELANVPTVWLTFVMCLLNGEGLLLGIGVVYLVDVYHFDNSTAATVILPGGIGALIGTVGGGFIADALQHRAGHLRQVAFYQITMLMCGLLIIPTTQVDWGNITLFYPLFFLYGLNYGASIVATRPIIFATILPEQVGLTIALESSLAAISGAFLSWAFTALSSTVDMKTAVLVLIAGLILCKTALITRLYHTVPKDAHNLRVTMESRAATMAHSHSPP
ncbi:putative 3-hydroxyphenylpropionic transporter MhpT [Mycobacteroides abscessus subsp. bolletii]|nr:putative 3-hydroxyphenylpropionic transporter MhpT [Mycobacteroides abscessus subsp. bolletii]SLD80175.1 putative 3-hydroxyphenylpropionic transporter MhpT [Mycobacteroides abscessus subsp. bolletii]SLD87101.1 putative 3-hydroxyphenylpropionic transporter MhpT [Mycobacteroides abscessus subsp. bolletii]